MVFLIQIKKKNTIKTKKIQTNKNLKRRNDLNVHKIYCSIQDGFSVFAGLSLMLNCFNVASNAESFPVK